MTLEDGYRLWLRYEPLADASLRAQYRAAWAEIVFDASSATLQAARRELDEGLEGLLGPPIAFAADGAARGTLLVGTPRSSRTAAALIDADAELREALGRVGPEGFVLRRLARPGPPYTVLVANEDIGVLYGVFFALRHLQTARTLDAIGAEQAPKLRLRMLDHWDNLDRTVERGYAGFSIWNWHALPGHVAPRYEDYARANASIGVNAAALTNVNADALVLTDEYLRKVAALAEAFRPYGIRVYLTARFSAPIDIGGLQTADPIEPSVARFWSEKAAEIYRHVPDFGGFLVKANSEGQPGPGDYGRTHADGANLLADALAPYGGTVIWRAFVYANDGTGDRAKQAYDELVPLDGRFRENVLVQVKNGPIDFQPREPFHPLFGAMPKTPLLAEFQLTQEYLGFATHLAYLGPLIEEVLDSDTHAAGEGSTVAKVIAGTLHAADAKDARASRASGMAAVSNVGDDVNWCGHPFAQANWFAFGRLAWDPDLCAEAIADDWIRMTFSNDDRLVAPVRGMMMGSREAVVEYMTPLGLHHLMAWDHHYGPGPWISEGRADWTSVYFHRADAEGLGFDRTKAGSDAIGQYATAVGERFARLETCPEELLLWFHHVPWGWRMKSGRTLWEELCHKYAHGVEAVRAMGATWASIEGLVDRRRHAEVASLLRVQENEATWWRDACVLYFQTFSQRPLPPGYEAPARTLDEYVRVRHHGVPGI